MYALHLSTGTRRYCERKVSMVTKFGSFCILRDPPGNDLCVAITVSENCLQTTQSKEQLEHNQQAT